MKLENNGGSSSTIGINNSTLSHAPSVMANSINSPTTVNNSAENQHKPSLNSVGSCVSSSTDEGGCSSESPQHKISRPQVLPQYSVSFYISIVFKLRQVGIRGIEFSFIKDKVIFQAFIECSYICKVYGSHWSSLLLGNATLIFRQVAIRCC